MANEGGAVRGQGIHGHAAKTAHLSFYQKLI